MKEIATNQAEIEAVRKLDEEHDLDLASNKESLLKSAVSSHEHVQAYLQNQIEAEHIPVVMETNLSPPKIDDPTPQVSVPALNQGNLNPETKPFVPTPPATVQQANNAVSNPTLQPTPTEFDHDPHHNTSNVTTVPRQPTSDAGVLTRLVDLLSQRNNHDSLPRPEPEVFDGNLLRYPTWVKSFKTFIERKTTDPLERLFYLVRFTSGEAREAINGLLPLNTEQAYTKAKKILSCRFGNPFLVSNAYRKKIDEWPKIPANDGASLRKFSDFLQHCCTAMVHIQYLSVLEDPEENQKILKKLPSYIVNKWGRIVDKSTSDDPEVGPDEESDESVISLNTYPTFKEFCHFLTTEARIACHPVTSQRSLKSKETSNLNKKKWIPKSGGIGARSFAIDSNEEQKGRQTNEQVNQQDIVKSKLRCTYCKEEHELDTCVKFLEISIPNRRAFIISKCLCWGCLKWGHNNRSCRRKKNCRTCGEVHPTVLHGDKPNQGKPYGNLKPKEVPKPNEEVNSQESTISNCIEVLDTKATGEPVSHSFTVPVWVHHSNDMGRKILTYALLDDQSDTCFVKDSALEALGINGPEVELKLSTVLAQKKIKSRKITGLVVRGVNETVDIAFTKDLLTRHHTCTTRSNSEKRNSSNVAAFKENCKSSNAIKEKHRGWITHWRKLYTCYKTSRSFTWKGQRSLRYSNSALVGYCWFSDA